MTNPNTDVWLSLLRGGVIATCSVLVTKGVISAADAPAIQTALLTLLPTLVAAGAAWWGGRSHTEAHVTAAAGNVPGVKVNVDAQAASSAVVAVATDPTKPNVNLVSGA